MRGQRLTAARRPLLGAIAAASCLGLAACSASPGTASPSASTSPTMSAAAQNFCRQVDDAFHSLDGYDVTPTMSLAAAHADVDKLMESAVTSFGKLADQAPAAIESAVRTIVADFRSFKLKSDKATSVGELMASTARGTPTESAAYHDLLAYTARTC
jgi:hypothetical protein